MSLLGIKIASVSRCRVLGIVLALAVGGLPIAPPEHVHEVEDHGHEHLLVHRHLAAHTADHHRDGHDGVLDDNDAPVLTLDAVYAVPATATLFGAPPSAVIAFIEPPTIRVVSRRVDYVEHLIHGPPRAPTGLRAPPLPSHL